MPALLEAAADLVLLAFIMLCIAFLSGLKVTVTPVLEAIAALVGKVPLIGDAARNLVIRGENAVLGAIDEAIKLNQGVAAGLFRALVWSWNLMVDAVVDLADNVESTLDWLANTHVAKVVAGALGTIPTDLAALGKTVSTLAGDVTREVGRLDTRITNGFTDVRKDLGADIVAARHSAEGYADTQLGAAERVLRREIGEAVGGATAPLAEAIGTLRTAEQTAVSNLNLAITAAEGTAEAFASGLVNRTEGALAGAIAAAESRAVSAEGVIAGEVSDVTDHLKTLLGELSFADAAALLASVPALAVLVHTIADESGLGRAEARGKVKAICGVDPDIWAELVGALVLFEGIPTLRELVDGAGELLREIEGPILDFVRAA